MKLTKDVKIILLNAEAKALATSNKKDINVVPVSSIKIVGDKIWLVDYFFDKTAKNIKENPKAALTFWTGLRGYQIKANITYVKEGEIFTEAKKWISETHPNREVKGVLILTILDIFDISIHNKQL